VHLLDVQVRCSLYISAIFSSDCRWMAKLQLNSGFYLEKSKNMVPPSCHDIFFNLRFQFIGKNVHSSYVRSVCADKKKSYTVEYTRLLSIHVHNSYDCSGCTYYVHANAKCAHERCKYLLSMRILSIYFEHTRTF